LLRPKELHCHRDADKSLVEDGSGSLDEGGDENLEGEESLEEEFPEEEQGNTLVGNLEEAIEILDGEDGHSVQE